MASFSIQGIPNIIKSIQDLKGTLRDEVEGAVKDFAEDLVRNLAQENVVGDPDRFPELYALRQKYQGFKPIAGLSRGNWRVSKTLVTEPVQQYDTNPDSVAARAYNKMSFYKLGQSFWVVNNVPYINRLILGKYRSTSPASKGIDVTQAYADALKNFSVRLSSFK